MPTITYRPQHVCSREFQITYENDTITNVVIIGGCKGNLEGISKLLVGMQINEVISRLSGITCPGSRTRQTSCPDQISIALKQII